MNAPRPAAFLDRDGTLMVDTDYVRDPALVELLPGAAEAVRLLNDARVPVVIVTNQSGIARGRIAPHEYEAVHARLVALLEAEGARVDDVFMCPHAPELSGPCECRKPGTLLYRQAAERHGLDAARSLFAGDRWRDVAPGIALGGHAWLVPGPRTPDDERTRAEGERRVAASLLQVVHDFLGATP